MTPDFKAIVARDKEVEFPTESPIGSFVPYEELIKSYGDRRALIALVCEARDIFKWLPPLEFEFGNDKWRKRRDYFLGATRELP